MSECTETHSSFTEQVLNVGSGYILSLLLWLYIIVPVLDVQTSMADNIIITSSFTVLSVIRGYIWRRVFNSNSKLLKIGEK